MRLFPRFAAACFVLAGLAPILAPATTGRTVARASGAPTAGYWLVADDGGVFAYGSAGFFGSTGAIRLNQPIVGMAATPAGRGYWMVASDGGLFAFGDAGFFGSTGGMRLNRPIVGMAATPSGRGYWLVASDGGIFSFGDARFFGSTGAIALAKPITGISPTHSGSGYWMVASDGGVFSFGDAAYHGAAPERAATGPRSVVTMAPTPTGAGYWQAAASGELLAFGDAVSLGHPAALSRPIVGLAAVPSAPVRAPIDPYDLSGPSVETTTTTRVPWPDTAPEYFANAANLTWGTSISTAGDGRAGRVLALAEAGDMVFVGGEFTGASFPGTDPDGDPNCRPDAATLSPPETCVLRPFLFALDADTGALLDWDARVNDAVLSLQVSPDGKQLYVGGRFTSIGGAPAGGIARLDIATATQDPTFRPPTADSGVRGLALHRDTLYIAGSFRRLDGVLQPSAIAALDAVTGAQRTDWVPPTNTGGRFFGQGGRPLEDGMPGIIYDMKISDDGRYLFVGGEFLHIGGQAGLLTLDAATGQASAWQADMGRPVFGIDIWAGDGTSVIVATGGAGGTAQFFTPGGGVKPKWVGRVDGDATDVVSTTERVYLVGHFDHEVPNKDDPCLKHVPVTCSAGTPHRKLVAFDALTGYSDPGFTAQANTETGPYVALIGRHHLYVGGDFTQVGPVRNLRPQPGFAAFERISEPGPAPPGTTATSTSSTSRATTTTT